MGADLSVNWGHSPSCHGSLALWHTDHWMLASWCVIRIRIRMLSPSTQTEVNEHVCLQWDVSLSEPAVTGLCMEIAEIDPCTCQLSISSSCLNFFPFLIFFDAVRLHLVEEEWASHYSWMCFAQVKSPDAIWKMPRVHDKLSVTLIIHRCRRLSLKNDCLCSVGSQCHRPPSHIFACVQNCICKHDNIFNTLYINED